jgi:hypothetical protein
MKTRTRLLILSSLTIATCSGCFYSAALPEIPAFDCPEVRVAECNQVKPIECAKLDMPEAVPKDVRLIIENGKAVKVDEGGEKLLRNYIGVRKAVKNLWGG